MPARVWNILHVRGTGDRGVAQLAGAQRGVAHRDQLAAVRIGRGAVAHRLSRGRLHRILPAVFALGNPVLEPLAAETAALLHAGDGSFLSHRTAAALWKIAPNPAGPIEVTTVIRKVRELPGLRLHRVHAIDLRDLRLHRGLPVSAPARTLIDLAAHSTADELHRALNEARVTNLVTDDELHRAIGRCPHRAGTAALRKLLAAERGPAITRSELERRFKRLVSAGQLPQPIYNARLLDYTVDVLWPVERLVVEVDGYRFHGGRARFETDRRRDQRLAAAGYTVIRVTDRQLTGEPMAVAVRLAQALATARARLIEG